jgi:hypothetical protein
MQSQYAKPQDEKPVFFIMQPLECSERYAQCFHSKLYMQVLAFVTLTSHVCSNKELHFIYPDFAGSLMKAMFYGTKGLRFEEKTVLEY